MDDNRIVPIVMPKWGLSMAEGTLSAWHVEEGQAIKPGQEIMDVETDKIANAVEATDGGLLRRRVATVGAVYPVKALLGVLAPTDVTDAAIDAYIAGFQTPAAAEDEEAAGPASHFVETAAGRLRYAARPGEGDPIVFIHGFGGDLDNWLFNIDAAAAAGPAYALDLPGHGQSTKSVGTGGLESLADAAEEFMAALGLTGAHLVGHSLGGAVAAMLALREKGLVKSLTLINSAGLGEEINGDYVNGFVAAQSRRELKPVVRLLFADPDLASRQMIDDLLKYKRLDGVADALAAIASAAFANGRQAAALADRLAKLDIPVLVIWGAEDAVIPVAHAHALPDAEVAIIENAGHMTQMEAASRVNELIRAQAGRQA